MKKLLSFTLAALMVLVCVFSFASCGKKGKTLEEVKAAGKLVVATSPDFKPFEYLDGENVIGIEVEILEKICEKLGVELVLKGVDDRARQRRRRTARNHHLGAHRQGQRTSGRHGRQLAQQSHSRIHLSVLYQKTVFKHNGDSLQVVQKLSKSASHWRMVILGLSITK